MERQADHGDVDQPSTTTGLSNEIHQPSLKALSDWGLQAPNRPSPSSAVSESHVTMKRDFESAFPGLPPGQETKRFRSQSEGPSHLDTRDDTIGNSGPTVEGIVEHDDADADADVDADAAAAAASAIATTVTDTTIAPPVDESCETEQPSSQTLTEWLPLFPLLENLFATPPPVVNAFEVNGTSDHDQAENICERSREEIRKHIEVIKHNSPDRQTVLQTVEILKSGVTALTAADDMAPVVEEILGMSRQICQLTYQPQLEIDEPGCHTTPLLSQPISLPSAPTPSPLTSCYSGPRHSPVPEFSVVSSSSVTEAKYEEAATQTDTVVVDRGSDALDACHHNVSDNELWERELEHIRRPQPLFEGVCTVVDVPLRIPAIQSVSESASGGGMGNRDLIPKSRANPEPSRECGTAAGKKNHNVIDLVNIPDDEDEDVFVRTSHRVGGGDLIYGSNGAQYVPSDDEEEAMVVYEPAHFDAPYSSSNAVAADDLLDYEEYEEFDNYAYDENLKEEELTGYNKYATAPTSSTGRYYYDGAVDDHYNHRGQQTEASLIHDDIIGVSGSKSRGRSNALRKQGTITPLKGAAERESSRSPGYRRTDHAKQGTYRENRYYTRKYATDGTTDDLSPVTASSDRVDRENQKDTRKALAETRGRNGWPRPTNPYTRQRQRYMKEEPEAASFYGYGAGAAWGTMADKALRYQDRFADAGEIPGPRSGLRLKLDEYARDTGVDKELAEGLEPAILAVLGETFYAGETLDEEQAWHRSWANDSLELYSGFPLVERVEFVAAGNHEEPAGDCYWRALAYSLHGTPARWDLVKAAHLAYLRHVLGDRTHPRHELYAQLNARFFESSGPNQKKKKGAGGVFRANLWQLLHMPHAWTPGVMQQVTADLYSLHLVTFTYDGRGSNLCSEVSVRGAYNARHVFMLFVDGAHFQPLAVNAYLG